MIDNKKDLKAILKTEKNIYNPFVFGKIIKHERTLLWHYVKNLRYLEYYKNTNKKIRGLFRKIKWYKLSTRYGMRIPENTCEEGLSIAHIGNIQINKGVKIGKNCRIHIDVVIGANKNGCPSIGDNVYIGAGAKIYSNCKIGNNVRIAPNACVSKDINDNEIWGGVPAKFIKINNQD